jgi:O-acetylserine/cysteine efflux transporter
MELLGKEYYLVTPIEVFYNGLPTINLLLRIMQIRHILLSLLVVAIWGFNFVVVTVALEGFPPLFLVFARLFLTSIPAVFFIKKPNIPFKKVIYYGLIMFGLQFSLLFMGMYQGVTPGLASLLQQTQVFFTILFAIILLKERFTTWQAVGALISFIGVAFIGTHIGGEVTLLGLLLVISAAAAWGVGNLMTKKFGKIDIIALSVWASFVAWPVVLSLSLLLEGPEKILYSIENISWLSVLAILYLTYLSTFVAYCAWGWLIHHLPLTTVAPFALLVPIFGILSSVLVLGEPLPLWKIIAAILVISGLCVSLLGPLIFSQKVKMHIKKMMNSSSV